MGHQKVIKGQIAPMVEHHDKAVTVQVGVLLCPQMRFGAMAAPQFPVQPVAR